jgi:large subunit ribosomal protein L30
MSAASRKKATATGTIDVRQVRSGIGYSSDQKATLRALGLGRVGKVRTLPDNPQVRGMVGKIPHLVVIMSAERGGGEAAGKA